MLKKIFGLLVALMLLFVLQGWSQGGVSGLVTGTGKQALASASVLLLNASDSSLVKGSVTGAQGRYSFIGLAPGRYLVAASFAGFRQAYSPAFLLQGNGELTVEELRLTVKESSLNVVTVSAKKPLFEQKIDRMVINVAGSVTAAGSTVLDVLMRSPGIIVDQQASTLSMNGKDGVVVMLNGKISRMPLASVVQMLAGMSSANIEKIELITTPPAAFDAEGNAGFINIVLKTNTQYGTNGSYSATAGYGQKPVAAVSAAFNHRSGKANFFGDYSFDRTGLVNTFSFYRKVVQGSRVLETDAATDRDAFRRNHSGRLGLDVELGRKTTAGFLFNTLHNIYGMEALNTSRIFVNGPLDTTISINNNERHPLSNYSGNVNLVQQFGAEEKLTLNADYVSYKDANDVNYLNRYFNGAGTFLSSEATRSFKTTPIRFWVGGADYTKKLSAAVDVEAGLKATFSRFTNDVRVERGVQSGWKADPSLTSKNFLQESIYAAYASFGLKAGKNTAAKIGLRYEYTNSNLRSETVKNIVDRHYGNLFPTLFLSRTLSETQSLNLAYSRRITRPTFNDMAPFVYFIDPNTFFSGNPALQPTISNAGKIDYLIKRLVFSLSYTHEDAPISNFAPRVDAASNKQTLAAENQKNRRTLSVNFSLPVRLTSWWSTQNNLSCLWQELNAVYKGSPLQITQKSANLNSMQTFTLPKDYSVELGGYLQSGGLFGIYQMKPFGSMDLGVQKKFAGGKSNLRLNLSDVFGAPWFKPSVDLPEQNLVTRGKLQFNNRMVRLTFTRSFGSNGVKEARSRTTAAEEERQRVNAN